MSVIERRKTSLGQFLDQQPPGLVAPALILTK